MYNLKSRTTKKKKFHSFTLGGYNIALPKNPYQKIIQQDMFNNKRPLPFLVKCLYNDGMESFPIIDTKLKLGMKAFNGNNESCILVERYHISKTKYFKLGLLMNQYNGLFSVPSKDIKLQSKGIMYEFDDFIRGMCNLNGTDHLVISLRNIFSTEEMIEFYNLYQENKLEHSYIPVYNNHFVGNKTPV